MYLPRSFIDRIRKTNSFHSSAIYRHVGTCPYPYIHTYIHRYIHTCTNSVHGLWKTERHTRSAFHSDDSEANQRAVRYGCERRTRRRFFSGGPLNDKHWTMLSSGSKKGRDVTGGNNRPRRDALSLVDFQKSVAKERLAKGEGTQPAQLGEYGF